jgi:hypothetical protein
MGHFKAINASYFKIAQDGRKLFYPWGIMGRGFVIPTQEHFERLQRQLETYTLVMLVIVGSVVVLDVLWAFAVAAVFIIFYLAWMPYLLRGLQPSDERLSMRESMATQARMHSAAGLWLMLCGSLLFVAIGGVLLVVDPDEWIIGLLSVGFFGLCAAVFVRMLLLRPHTTGTVT